uniref:Serine hydrolase like n=1 Tax=Sparus aurata TaxID=8175 RepID=A0A671YNN9_SPAAU
EDRKGKVWGPDRGRPVLCLHGWADNCGSFSTLIPLLPKECRYVAVDLAGHGLSSHRPPGAFYSSPEYVADVCRVVDGCNHRIDTVRTPQRHKTEISKVMRQGMDETLEYEKKTEKKKRVYTYEKAAERLLAANPTLSEQSVNILLERGLLQVEGGFAFSRDLRVNFKNVIRMSWEQSLEFQARIQASLLVVLADSGFDRILSEPAQSRFTTTLLQCLRDRNVTPGDHYVHLSKPEVVAPFVSDFLRSKTCVLLCECSSCTRLKLCLNLELTPISFLQF